MRTLKLDAKLNELHKLKEFIHKIYKKNFLIDLIIEEIFVNIIKYSSAEFIKVNIEVNKDKPDTTKITIEFIDNGKKFNPLLIDTSKFEKNMSDVKIGGRGILLIKHYADELIYEYLNNENHLTVIKRVKKQEEATKTK